MGASKRENWWSEWALRWMRHVWRGATNRRRRARDAVRTVGSGASDCGPNIEPEDAIALISDPAARAELTAFLANLAQRCRDEETRKATESIARHSLRVQRFAVGIAVLSLAVAVTSLVAQFGGMGT